MDKDSATGCGCVSIAFLILPALVLSLYLDQFWPLVLSIVLTLGLLLLVGMSESTPSSADSDNNWEEIVERYNVKREESDQVRAAREKAAQRREEATLLKKFGQKKAKSNGSKAGKEIIVPKSYRAKVSTSDQVKASREKAEQAKAQPQEFKTSGSEKIALIHHMPGLKFEIFMKRFLEHQGYKVVLTKFSGDQGVDLIIEEEGRKIAIQLKRYARPLGNKPVQEVIAGRIFYKADEAWVIATSSFTSGAVELAKRAGVTLINGRELAEWLEEEWDEDLSNLLHP